MAGVVGGVPKDDDYREGVVQPVLDMPGLRPEPPAVLCRRTEEARAGLDLERQDTAGGPPVFDDLDLGIHAVVTGRLFSEEPAQISFDAQPDVRHTNGRCLG